jgi:hypothetical protein
VINRGFIDTVRVVLPDTPPNDVEMVVVPGFRAVASPLRLTLATVGFEDVHFA